MSATLLDDVAAAYLQCCEWRAPDADGKRRRGSPPWAAWHHALLCPTARRLRISCLGLPAQLCFDAKIQAAWGMLRSAGLQSSPLQFEAALGTGSLSALPGLLAVLSVTASCTHGPQGDLAAASGGQQQQAQAGRAAPGGPQPPVTLLQR